MLAGDYRQNLPVIPRANRARIVNSTHPHSPLWQHFTVMKLEENLRLRHETDQRTVDYAAWLVRVGNGDEPMASADYPSDFIPLPDDLCGPENFGSLIDATFPDMPRHCMDPAWMANRSILSPTNASVAEINEKVIERVPGEASLHFSADELVMDDSSGGGIDVPQEYLNTLTPSGMPPHVLELKPGVPLMLLRNLDPAAKMCNGTRLILKEVVSGGRLLRATIAGTQEEHLMPRITLRPKDGDYPFTFSRRQFPVRLCFAMTINKSQGQTLANVGVDLRTTCFAHGQLYVAASRITSPRGITFLAPGRVTRNVVFKEALLS